MRTESFVHLFEQAAPVAVAVFTLLLVVVFMIWFGTRKP